MRKLMMAISICTMALIGCVSIEGTRAQLNSKIPSEVQKAEDTIWTIAIEGRDPNGLMQFNAQQQVEYVRLLSNSELLLKIMNNAIASGKKDVAIAAAERIDFFACGKGEVACFFGAYYEQLKRIDEKVASKLRNKIVTKMSKDDLVDFVIKKKMNDTELLKQFCKVASIPLLMKLRDDGNRDTFIKEQLISKLDKTNDITSILKIRESLGRYGFDSEDVDTLLLSKLHYIKDEETILKLCTSKIRGYNHKFLLNNENRLLLLKNLPNNRMVEILLDDINDHSLYDWNDDKLQPLEMGLFAAREINDRRSKLRLVMSVIKKVAAHRKECDDKIGYTWEKNDAKKAMELLSQIKGFSETEIAALICSSNKAWEYLIDNVSASCAYTVLTHGKAKLRDFEEALVNKLPQEKIDMKVFAGLNTDLGRRTAMKLMSNENKEMAKKLIAQEANSVFDKAKDAKKGTFELSGFYLGMDFDDVKKLIAYHFPDIEFAEMRDGNDDDANYVIRIDKQSTYFCTASAKDKKVFVFNFGKVLLKKWYKYDVQSYLEWASKYEDEHSIDMQYKMIDKDTVTSSNDRVWFHQESYQYKHNTKEYRLTYFGEEQDWTYEGGFNGTVIKAEAAAAFQYIRADAGTLRAKIERD